MKRIFSIILTIMLVIGMVPQFASAQETGETAGADFLLAAGTTDAADAPVEISGTDPLIAAGVQDAAEASVEAAGTAGEAGAGCAGATLAAVDTAGSGCVLTAKKAGDAALAVCIMAAREAAAASAEESASLQEDDHMMTDEAEHHWSGWTVLVPATETEQGIESRTCYDCGETEIRIREYVSGENPGYYQPDFNDVMSAEYFYDAVMWAVDYGITNGTTGSTFSPYDICTRGQAVTFLWRAAGSEIVTNAGNPFRDVREGSYYYDAVLWANRNNITNGTTASTFEPDKICTRGQIVTFLWRSLGRPNPNITWSFDDVSSSAFYNAAVRWAVEYSVTKGTSGYEFSPENPCTRGQIVTFLYRKCFTTGSGILTGQEFVDAVARYVQQYAQSYGIYVHSPVIAQAILESGWGKSRLSALYHNYFGLKCGSRWTGKSVTLKTKEEYTQGVMTTIYANFRAYDSMEEGIKGYFDFIQADRYSNLKGITDPQAYLETIRADGYATSYTYVEQCMNLIEQYDLTRFDP